MNSPRLVRVLPLATLGAALALTSCSRHARASKLLNRADHDRAAGRYDTAEIEYKNALQLEPTNADGFGRLGQLYRDEGRLADAIALLRRAKELKPDAIPYRSALGVAMLAAGDRPSARAEAEFVLAHAPTDPDAPLLLVEASTSSADLLAAHSRLTSLPSPVAQSAPVLVALGQLDLRRGQPASAQRWFARAVTADPKSASAHAALASVALARRDFATADRELRKAADLSPIRSPHRLNYAQFKLQRGDPAAAAQWLDAMLRDAPDLLPGWLTRAQVALAQNQPAAAADFVAKALARDGTMPEALLLSARIHVVQHQLDKAATVLERVTALYPNAAVGHFEYGRVLAEQGKAGAARDQLMRASALAPGFTPVTLALAELQVKEGDFGPAIATLAKLTTEHPENAAAQLLLAQAYRGQGSFERALAIYEALEKSAPLNPETPYLRGLVLRQMDRTAFARAAFARAADMAPASLAPVEQLVDLDISEQDYAAARRRIETVAAQNPKSERPPILLSRVCLAQGDMAGAEQALQRAIAIKPDSSDAHLQLARLYVTTHQEAKAAADLRQLLQHDPKDPNALTMLALLSDVQNDPNGARDAYEKLIAVQPENALALNNLAYLYAEKFNRLDAAFDLAQKAHSLAPNDPRASDTLGWVLYHKHQFAAAVALLQDSAAALPDDATVQFHYGMTAYMLGSDAAARTALTKVAAAHPPAADADEARRRLALLTLDPVRDPAKARSALDAAIRAQPDDPVAQTKLAALLLTARDLPGARTAADAALRASPQNGAAQLVLARVLEAQGEIPKAIEAAKSARDLAPGPEASHLLGRLVFTQGDFRWASSLLREAAQAQPDDADTQFDWALAAYSMGQVNEATAAAQHALEQPNFARAADARRFLALVAFAATPSEDTAKNLQPMLQGAEKTVPALVAQAALAQLRSDWKTAITDYEAALAQYPEFAPAQRALVLLYADHLDDATKAAAIAAKARRTYPGDAELARAAGIIVYRTGDYSRAAALLQQSAGALKPDSELLYYLGMAQFQLNRKSESRQTLKQALDAGLRSDLVPEAKRTLALAE